MNKIILAITLMICATSIFASIQVNKRMDRPIGDFDEDQAYGEVNSNISPDLSGATKSVQEVEVPQIDYLKPPEFAVPITPPPTPEDTFQ